MYLFVSICITVHQLACLLSVYITLYLFAILFTCTSPYHIVPLYVKMYQHVPVWNYYNMFVSTCICLHSLLSSCIILYIHLYNILLASINLYHIQSVSITLYQFISTCFSFYQDMSICISLYLFVSTFITSAYLYTTRPKVFVHHQKCHKWHNHIQIQ